MRRLALGLLLSAAVSVGHGLLPQGAAESGLACLTCADSPERPRPSAGDELVAGRMRDAIAAREYWVSPSGDGIQAPNRRHSLRTWFEPDGIRVADRAESSGPDLLAMRPARWGRKSTLDEVGPGVVVHEGARVKIVRGEIGLVEWYENSAKGLEQGFTLSERPTGDGDVQIEISVDHARVQLEGEAIRFRADVGRPLRFAKLHTYDDRGRELDSRFETTPDGFRIVVADAGAHYPIVIDPLLTSSFDNEVESNQQDALLGHSVAGAGDVNGDGFDDVIVGADFFDNGQVDEGAAFIFHGGPNGVGDGNPINADTLLESNQADARFGYRVRSAGDVNGDGYSDVIVGAFLYDAGQLDEGSAWVWHGGPSGISNGNPSTADTQLESDQVGARFGVSAESAGDVNGDGYSDVIVGAYFYDNPEPGEGAAFLYLGSATGIASGGPAAADALFESNQEAAYLGWRAATAGDVDADGYDDIIIGILLYDSIEVDQGAIVVFHGGPAGIADGHPGTADLVVVGDAAGDQMGSAVSSAGDTDGDGYGDVVFGAYLSDASQTDGGSVYWWRGSANGLVAGGTPLGGRSDSSFGLSLAAAGDVNADGYGDVLMAESRLGTPGQSQEGIVYLFQGGPAGLDLSAVLYGDQANAEFGLDLGGAGDVNGDGYDDVIAGARYFDGPQDDEGKAFVYHGGASGVLRGSISQGDWLVTPGEANARLGESVASAGDINGDGYDDLIVGASNYDAGETSEGAAFLFLGSASATATLDPAGAHAQLEGDQEGALFGSSVASAGDVNGDGYADVIIGAWGHDGVGSNSGAAYVFLGSSLGIADGGPASAHAMIESGQSSATLGGDVSSAGDVDGDGFSDVIVGARLYDAGQQDEGAAFIFRGSPDGITGTGPATADTRLESDEEGALLGQSVACAGDVNGDGYGDVIVGAAVYSENEVQDGSAWIWLGGAGGIASGSVATADSQLVGDRAVALLGWSVASAGDVNGDGFDDVIVGAQNYSNSHPAEGAAFVFLGGSSGVASGDSTTAHARLEGNQDFALFGWSVSGAGDTNGDGYGDVAVGAILYDDFYSDEGGVFVFHGSEAGIADGDPGTAAADIHGDQKDAEIGDSVASAGDLNGDGHADLVLGADTYNGEGMAAVFLGSESDRPPGPRQLRGDGSGVPVEPWGGSYDDDSFVVGFDVVSPVGRELGKVEVEACPAGVGFGDLACTLHESAAWLDLGTTGASFNEAIAGLTEGELYHWRARALYAPLSSNQPGIIPVIRAGPWLRAGGNSGTADIRIVPEPGSLPGLASALCLLGLLARRRRRDR